MRKISLSARFCKPPPPKLLIQVPVSDKLSGISIEPISFGDGDLLK